MMGRLDDRQQPLFYDFCLEDHVPDEAHSSAASATPKKTARFNEFLPQDIPDVIR